MNDSESEWEKLLRASKPACPVVPEEDGEIILSRIGGLREAVHAMAIALTWRKLSLIALALAALLLAGMFLKSSRSRDAPSLIVPAAPNEITEP